jgi:soluble lytic murein transglycosylase-like protein
MKWDAEVADAARAWRVDPALIHGIIQKETLHGALPLVNREAKGGFSYGPMQVRDATATTVLHVAPASLADPRRGIYYGTQYLASLILRFNGDIERAISGYNAGPGNAKKTKAGTWINQKYVTDVLSFWNRFKRAAVSAAPVALPLLLIGGLLLWARARRRAA